MSTEENKAMVRRFIEDVFNKQNVSALDGFLAPNVVHHSLPPGMPRDREGFKQLVSVLLAAFPDFHSTVEDMIAEGDKVVARATTGGTHKGEFFGIPPYRQAGDMDRDFNLAHRRREGSGNVG